jgi:hypothetical protein
MGEAQESKGKNNSKYRGLSASVEMTKGGVERTKGGRVREQAKPSVKPSFSGSL